MGGDARTPGRTSATQTVFCSIPIATMVTSTRTARFSSSFPCWQPVYARIGHCTTLQSPLRDAPLATDFMPVPAQPASTAPQDAVLPVMAPLSHGRLWHLLPDGAHTGARRHAGATDSKPGIRTVSGPYAALLWTNASAVARPASSTPWLQGQNLCGSVW